MPVVTLYNPEYNPERPVGNNICTCCALDKDVIAAPEFLEATVEELEQAWRAGCRACKLRYQVALEFQAALEDSFQFYGLHTFSKDHGDSWELFRPSGDLRADVAAIPLKLVLPGYTNSQATFWTVHGWIQNCLMNHDDCTGFQSSFTPTRLVEVGAGQVTLREGLQNISYACLSHCWGASQSTIRTLTSNIDYFKRLIPWEDLSRTFHDAIDICRRLDIQYIWIDSLCIIQDSEQDWKHESLTMASVYENAFITIAATKSPDGAGGCYSNYRVNDTFTVTFEGGDVLLRKKPAWLNYFNRHDTWPLLTRGWAFQEMHLSPRVLHFGRDEVIWQCRTCRLSESGSNDSTARSTLDRSALGQVKIRCCPWGLPLLQVNLCYPATTKNSVVEASNERLDHTLKLPCF
ncbi:hypothetical protein E8E14_009881 [Neopestalotiopsis sp. 37M]|nr:hypothetical protein E8E14_009881 [Neopestalotiopsis sp. 37M]